MIQDNEGRIYKHLLPEAEGYWLTLFGGTRPDAVFGPLDDLRRAL